MRTDGRGRGDDNAIVIATVTAALPPSVHFYVLAYHFRRHAEEAACSFALGTTLSGLSVAVVMQLLISCWTAGPSVPAL